MNNIRIREYQNQDKDQIIKLMHSFNQFIESLDDMHRVKYIEGGESYFTDKTLEEVRENEGKLFVAEINNQIIGFIAGIVMKMSDDDLKETVPTKPGSITELYIDPNYQKQRIGKQLIEEIEKYFKSIGCDVIKVEVFAPNQNAYNFYMNLGFEVRNYDLIKKLDLIQSSKFVD